MLNAQCSMLNIGGGEAERVRYWALSIGLWALLVVSAAGCAKAGAATVPNGPPLAMPQPPPRVFAPVGEEPLAASPAVETPAAEAPQLTPPRPRGRTTPATAGAEKPEPLPAPAPTVEPLRELRAASTPADAEADRKIRALLNIASGDLGKVDYGKLSREGKEQYDQAKSFAQQADAALTQRNYVFAETLADKAAKLATELLGR